MSIYISKNNQQQGPFEEATILEWLKSGQLSLTDLACREGANEWQQLNVLLPNVVISQTSNNPLAMGLLQQVAGEIENSPVSGVIARSFDVREGYDPQLESFCKEMIEQCDRAEQSAPGDTDVLRTSLVLKAQLYGNWQKMSGMRGTQKSAIECYERALTLVKSPEMEADVRFNYGLLCAVAVAGVGGGKDKAVANYQRVIELVGAESELGQEAANAMGGTKSGARCFVATAAYGSPLAHEVVVFSRFRDEVLLKSRLGTSFTKTYYFASPPFARMISKASFLRSVVRRIILSPILTLVKRYFDS